MNRQVERILWRPRPPGRLCLLALSSYCWLLALCTCEWKWICLPLTLQSMLPHSVQNHFQGRLLFMADNELLAWIPSSSLCLVAGTRQYLDMWSKVLPSTVPALCYQTESRSRGPISGWKFRQVNHQNVGGVTTVWMAIGYHGFFHWPQFRPAVARRLAHVITFSERPRPVRVNHPTPHYLGSDLLSPQHLTRPIRYDTYMVAGSWGERSLVPSELWDAFDIPSWVHELPTGFPPIKIILASLEAFLASPPREGPPPSGVPISRPSGRQKAVPDLGISPSRNPSGATSLERHLGPTPGLSGALMVPDTASSTYLPSLERCLPHSCADPSLVSTKAAKYNDAAVAFATWNQRILLVVLPRVDPHPTQVRRPPPSPTHAPVV
jgi:hypothetical protein